MDLFKTFDIRKIKRFDLIDLCKDILHTNNELNFINATEKTVGLILHLGLTVRHDIKRGKLFDIRVTSE